MKRTPLIILALSMALTSLSPSKGKQPDLLLAAKDGNTARIEALIREGSQVDVVNVEGTTPLMAACEAGKLEAAKLLVAHGAKINFQSKTAPYHTPLFRAALSSQYEMVRWLLENRADRSIQDSVGKTALVRAKERRECEDGGAAGSSDYTNIPSVRSKHQNIAMMPSA